MTASAMPRLAVPTLRLFPAGQTVGVAKAGAPGASYAVCWISWIPTIASGRQVFNELLIESKKKSALASSDD